MTLPDLGTSSGIALLVMLIVGLAKWQVEGLRGTRTGALVVAGAVVLAILHAVILGARTPIELEQAALVGLVGAAEALAVAAAVRAAAKAPPLSSDQSYGTPVDV